ncbi:hypothetical protein [Microbacterium sp.]|uniref:hypothetical protein n=1 Tax=Microbacterium sp. TaxID=51671 RepID=UPI0028126BFF|nr:hypothetical protein [Microbacterium sp.]
MNLADATAAAQAALTVFDDTAALDGTVYADRDGWAFSWRLGGSDLVPLGTGPVLVDCNGSVRLLGSLDERPRLSAMERVRTV